MTPAIRVLHLFAFVMWIGPTTAGYLTLRRAIRDRRQGRPLPRAMELWVWRRFELLLRLEHAAFAVLVLSGLALLLDYGLSPAAVATQGPRWLQLKLALVFAVLVPLEAYDIYLSHVRLPRTLARLASSAEPLADHLGSHERFLARGVWLFAVLLPALLYLVAYRP